MSIVLLFLWNFFNIYSKMDEVLSYCHACLSSDRKLYPINDLQSLLYSISLFELFSSPGGVCWECRHLIRKFAKFKSKVKLTQNLLCNSAKVANLQTTPSFSSLTIQLNVQPNEYQYSYDPLTNPETQENKIPEVKIKQEVQEETTHEEKISDGERSHDDELFDEILDCESKPAPDIDVGILCDNDKKNHKKFTKKKRHKKITEKDSEEEVKQEKVSEEELKEKFTSVVFTEEEMIKNREEKRNGPNFKKIPYKCDSCVLGFTRKDTYDLHLEKKHDEKIGAHICPVCLCRFPTQRQADRHRSRHYIMYRCRLCKYETLELWSAAAHCRTKHEGDQPARIHCRCCAAVARTPEELSQHMTEEHSVYCNECGQKFKALNTLRSHIRRVHTIKREFTCDICSKAFNTKTRLESHLVSHNAALAQKLAYCAPCRVQYKNLYVYRNHLRTSANHAEQAYQCVECNKRFASKVYWKKHYNFYHLQKSQFRCDLCNKLFISDWRLKCHRQTQHGQDRSRDHHCNVCGKQFFTLATLKGHQLTHSEQRSFMCEDCGDTFKQRPALYTHCRLVHRGLKRRRVVA